MRQADIAVYDRDHDMQLVAEVQSRTGASQDWVREIRRNLLAAKAIPQAPYFLLAMPDAFYLWTPASRNDPDAPPEHRIDAREALAPYVRGFEVSLETINSYSLQLLVSSWLQDLAFAEPVRERNGSAGWLGSSGLDQAIRRGSVDVDVAV
jgi:hypothetical protein